MYDEALIGFDILHSEYLSQLNAYFTEENTKPAEEIDETCEGLLQVFSTKILEAKTCQAMHLTFLFACKFHPIMLEKTVTLFFQKLRNDSLPLSWKQRCLKYLSIVLGHCVIQNKSEPKVFEKSIKYLAKILKNNKKSESTLKNETAELIREALTYVLTMKKDQIHYQKFVKYLSKIDPEWSTIDCNIPDLINKNLSSVSGLEESQNHFHDPFYSFPQIILSSKIELTTPTISESSTTLSTPRDDTQLPTPIPQKVFVEKEFKELASNGPSESTLNGAFIIPEEQKMCRKRIKSTDSHDFLFAKRHREEDEISSSHETDASLDNKAEGTGIIQATIGGLYERKQLKKQQKGRHSRRLFELTNKIRELNETK